MTASIFPEQIRVLVDPDDKEWPLTVRIIDDVGSEVTVFLSPDRKIELLKTLNNPEMPGAEGQDAD